LYIDKHIDLCNFIGFLNIQNILHILDIFIFLFVLCVVTCSVLCGSGFFFNFSFFLCLFFVYTDNVVLKSARGNSVSYMTDLMVRLDVLNF